MGATPKFAFPFADPSSPPDIGYWTQQLAAALEAKMDDTGWVDITVAGGFLPMASAEKPQCRRIGTIVYLRGGWQGGAGTGITAAGTAYTVGTMPAGFRPAVSTVGVCGSQVAAAIGGFHVQADGVIQIRTNATVGVYYKIDRQSYPTD